MPPALFVTNARVVLPDRVLDPGFLFAEEGFIVDIGEGKGRTPGRGGRVIDAAGGYLLPGLVDIHCDAIEKEIQPRPNVTMPVSAACRELERKLASAGITTIFHSISFSRGEGVRSNEQATEIVRFISRWAKEKHLIQNLVHLRYEISNTAALDLMAQLLEEGCGQLLSFMDHTPGQGQYKTLEQYIKYVKKTYWLDEKDCRELVAIKMRERAAMDPLQLRRLAATARRYGVAVASHDDDAPSKIEEWLAMGVTIAEFPVNLATARHAAGRGLHVCVGAPNLLRGGSHEQNLSAKQALSEGAADVLCSDYYPPALLQGVFELAEEGFGLPRAVCLATLNPARATGLDGSVGSLEPGKQADFILVQLPAGQPVVLYTVTGGKVVSAFSYHGREALAAREGNGIDRELLMSCTLGG